ncbi:MAG TPA: phosphate ABC transporter substrate-binding protein PstS [Chiayiivirga sp.]|nr:phosphate ABC transporter substrate-binding protein PstS [Chiayiivirga sp.]
MLKTFSRRLAAVLALVGLSVSAHAGEITGAGSSFVYPVMSKWSASYAEQGGDRINYQSIGSGGGIAQIKAGTVDFGASDKPLDSAELDAFALLQFPSVIGGIVPVYRLEGVEPGQLVLDGPTLAAIFLGQITRWNDAAIAALNPDLVLPDAKITVVHRSDGSGTSFNFTHYLSQVSADWKRLVGEGTAVDWPTGIGGKGNDGVAAYVGRMKGSIGYVEYAYAKKNALGYARLVNRAGTTVAPDRASFQAAAASADWANSPHFNLIMTDAPGTGAWPITATTWIIMPRQPRDAARSKRVLAFFNHAWSHGQSAAETLDYVPLPPSLRDRIAAYWSKHLAR